MKNRTARLVAAAAVGLGMFAPAGAAMAAETTVTPAPPVFRDACGTDKDEVVIPFTQGVDYYMSGVKVNPGVRPVNPASPRAEVFTRAQGGFTLSAPATWSHTFDAERGCDGQVYVKTGSVEPTVTTAPPATTVAPGGTTDTTVVVEQTESTTQVIQNTDEELPRTGFAEDMMTGVALAGALGAGALLVANRRLSRQEGGAHLG